MKIKPKGWIRNAAHSLRAVFRMLFSGRRHWVLIDIDKKNLTDLLSGKDHDIGVTWHQLHPYLALLLIKGVANTKTDIDMICMKAEFEAKAFDK